jgi:hypothetical protein
VNGDCANDDLDALIFNSLKCGGSVAIGYRPVGDVKQPGPGNYALQATFSNQKTNVVPGMCQFDLSLDDQSHYQGRLTVPAEFITVRR